MTKSKPPEEYLAEITVGYDSIEPVRKAKLWSRDKLGILAMYLPAFAVACRKRAPDFYFVDGLAGEGLYEFRDRDEHVLGSSLIALNCEPAFRKVVSMELNPKKANALRARSARFGDRSVVENGNCNEDLLRVMLEHIPDRAPTLVLLDPEGLELEWRTVEGLAGFRKGDRKVELLILVPTGSIGRVAEVAHESGTEGANRIDFMFPFPSGWTEIWERRQSGDLSGEDSRDAFAEIYRLGLERLGYAHTSVRAITHGGRDDASVYHLVFASDHPVGIQIMDHTFERMYANPKPDKRRLNPNQSSFLDLL